MNERGAARLRDLSGVDLGRRTNVYAARDAILYALSVGAKATDLDMVYERDLRVMPTFGLTLGLWAVQAAGELGAYDPRRTLHVGQELLVRKSLPASGGIETSAKISSVWDKGSAALVEVSVTSEFFDAVYLIYAVGAGGFGGERGQTSAVQPPIGDPDLHLSEPTREDQAALYRLTGDLHPVHIDPEVARASGFDRPILHGLCTLGTVTRAIAKRSGHHPAALVRLSARFTAPVYPGALLEVDCYREGAKLGFVSSVANTGKIIQGEVEFSEIE